MFQRIESVAFVVRVWEHERQPKSSAGVVQRLASSSMGYDEGCYQYGMENLKL